LASCLTTGFPMSPEAPMTAIFWKADILCEQLGKLEDEENVQKAGR
jgi:hypothetical protein